MIKVLFAKAAQKIKASWSHLVTHYHVQLHFK